MDIEGGRVGGVTGWETDIDIYIIESMYKIVNQ